MRKKLEGWPFGRRASYLSVWILIAGRPRLQCRIRNISLKGAPLELSPSERMHLKLKVLMEGRRASLDCEVRQRHLQSVRVECIENVSAEMVSPGWISVAEIDDVCGTGQISLLATSSPGALV
ncbi:MAG: hypothetical protein ABL907_25225 [Hyphomicrobium sp.]